MLHIIIASPILLCHAVGVIYEQHMHYMTKSLAPYTYIIIVIKTNEYVNSDGDEQAQEIRTTLQPAKHSNPTKINGKTNEKICMYRIIYTRTLYSNERQIKWGVYKPLLNVRFQ